MKQGASPACRRGRARRGRPDRTDRLRLVGLKLGDKPASSTKLTVFAAASLNKVFPQIAAAFRQPMPASRSPSTSPAPTR